MITAFDTVQQGLLTSALVVELELILVYRTVNKTSKENCMEKTQLVQQMMWTKTTNPQL